MIKAAKYPCNGGEISVAEAARALGVSSETICIRLSKYGGNMQRVWDHYAGAEKASEEAAVAEIMSALGMEETREAETPEPDAPEAPEIAAAEEIAPEPEADKAAEAPETPETSQDAALRAALRRLNGAIDALSGLYESDVGALSRELTGMIGRLRVIRATRYEKLVDWNEVAK